MIKLILTLLFCLLSLSVSSQDNYLKAIAKHTTSIKDGNWCITGTWDHGIPDPSKDTITISGTDSINAECRGTLIIGSQCSLHIIGCGILVVQNIQFNNGCIVIIDEGATLIILNDLINNNNSNNITINGNLFVTGNINNGVGADINGNGTIIASSVSGSCCIMGIDPITISGSVVITDSIIVNTLPIELLNFEVSLIDNEVKIDWATSSEINTDLFIIEKSNNLINFNMLDIVFAVGNSNENIEYSIYDINPTNGINYYRLKQVDKNGFYKYFDTKYIIYEQPFSFDIYPNPKDVDESLFIHISHSSAEEIMVVVINELGQELYSKIIITGFTNDIIEAIDPHERIPIGQYIVIATNKNAIFRKKLIVK